MQVVGTYGVVGLTFGSSRLNTKLGLGVHSPLALGEV